jgi:hypothetical protein
LKFWFFLSFDKIEFFLTEQAFEGVRHFQAKLRGYGKASHQVRVSVARKYGRTFDDMNQRLSLELCWPSRVAAACIPTSSAGRAGDTSMAVPWLVTAL